MSRTEQAKAGPKAKGVMVVLLRMPLDPALSPYALCGPSEELGW